MKKSIPRDLPKQKLNGPFSLENSLRFTISGANSAILTDDVKESQALCMVGAAFGYGTENPNRSSRSRDCGGFMLQEEAIGRLDATLSPKLPAYRINGRNTLYSSNIGVLMNRKDVTPGLIRDISGILGTYSAFQTNTTQSGKGSKLAAEERNEADQSNNEEDLGDRLAQLYRKTYKAAFLERAGVSSCSTCSSKSCPELQVAPSVIYGSNISIGALERLSSGIEKFRLSQVANAASPGGGHISSDMDHNNHRKNDIGKESTPPDEGPSIGMISFPHVMRGEKDLVVCHLLEHVLGGGSEFSFGGPGKGITSELYGNVLVKRPKMIFITSFNKIYGKNGLFGVVFVEKDRDGLKGSSSMVKQVLVNTLTTMTNAKLEEAKQGLLSSIYYGLENGLSGTAEMADTAVLLHRILGRFVNPIEVLSTVKNITFKDFMRIATRIVGPASNSIEING